MLAIHSKEEFKTEDFCKVLSDGKCLISNLWDCDSKIGLNIYISHGLDKYSWVLLSHYIGT